MGHDAESMMVEAGNEGVSVKRVYMACVRIGIRYEAVE